MYEKPSSALTCNMKLRIESNKDNRNRFNGFMTPPQQKRRAAIRPRSHSPVIVLEYVENVNNFSMVSALRNKSKRYALHNSPAHHA